MKNRKRKFDGSNRRVYRRLNPADIPSLKGVLINQGAEARVMDISMGGILLETEFRLRPEMKILLKVLTTKGILKINGYVLRSSIKSIAKTPIYQSAIVFDQPLSLLDDLEQKQEEQAPGIRPEATTPDIFEESTELKSDPVRPAPDNEMDMPILTVIAPEKFGAAIDDMFSLNDW